MVAALRRDRAVLALRWLGQFATGRAAAGHADVVIDDAVIVALLEDFIELLDPVPASAEGRPTDRAALLAGVAEFPENVAVAIDLLQAGAQVLGAYVVENAGPWAAWSLRDRNRFLGELDAIFPLLVRREVVGLCEHFLPGNAHHATHATDEMIGMPAWARAISSRCN